MTQHTESTAVQAQTPPSAPARKPKTLSDWLNSSEFKAAIATALPRHMDPDRLLRVVTTSLRKNPKLAQTTPESFLGSVIVLAQLGLEPDDGRGLAYLVPFNNSIKDGDGNWHKRLECTPIIGYRGYIELARRSGDVSSVDAMPVFDFGEGKADAFSFQYGTEKFLKHEPYMGSDVEFDAAAMRKATRAAYAVVAYKDGSKDFIVLPLRDIERARLSSKQPDGPAWKAWYPEQAAKTAIRRLAKRMPQSPELTLAQRVDEHGASLRVVSPGVAQLEVPEVEFQLPEHDSEGDRLADDAADRVASKAEAVRVHGAAKPADSAPKAST